MPLKDATVISATLTARKLLRRVVAETGERQYVALERVLRAEYERLLREERSA